MRKILYCGVIVMLLLTIMLVSCKKQTDSSEQLKKYLENAPETKDFLVYDDNIDYENPNEIGKNTIPKYNYDEVRAFLTKYQSTDITMEKIDDPKVEYAMPKEYLDDPLEFKKLDYARWKDKKAMVVGNNGVKLYDKIMTDSDDETAHTIADLPIGTILEVTKVFEKDKENISWDYENEDTYLRQAYYYFKKDYNNWFQVTYEGKKGFVFAAYDATYWQAVKGDDALDLSYFYQKKECSDEFVAVNGKYRFSDELMATLKKQHFALERVNKDEYELYLTAVQERMYDSENNSDDMVSLYKDLADGASHPHFSFSVFGNSFFNDRITSIYITTDFIVHSLHLVFDRMLQRIEQDRFFPILMVMIEEYYKEADEYAKTAKTDEEKEATELVKAFFLVVADTMGKPLIDIKEYPVAVKEEIAAIKDATATGRVSSILKKYTEDYTQYKPRGHYTKNAVLANYFKTMMYFGRMHFGVELKNDSTKDAFATARAGILMTYFAQKNSTIENGWRALTEPINYIMGASDDVTLKHMLACLRSFEISDMSQWISDTRSVIEFSKKLSSIAPKPQIAGFSLYDNNVKLDNNAEQPMGFRLMGQRFTFDNYIHNMLSSPRIGDYTAQPPTGRTMVAGTDVMAVLGNKEAEEITLNAVSHIKKGKENYTKLKKMAEKMEYNDWYSTFYMSYLGLVKDSATFTDKGFYFMQKPEWSKRVLLTAHAAWAELRHDTLLYAKQSYAEKAGGGGDPQPTFSIEPLEYQKNYVEPNMEFFYRLQSLLKIASIKLETAGFLNDAYRVKMKDLTNVVNNLTEIVRVEVKNGVVSGDDSEYIRKIPAILVDVVAPTEGNRVEEKDLQMALIADVHTDSDNDQVLEVATGMPYRIYVALNDGDGGKRIAIGYTYSYYEFTQPQDNRLNDDEWKAQVYSDDNKKLDDKIPAWLRPITPKK